MREVLNRMRKNTPKAASCSVARTEVLKQQSIDKNAVRFRAAGPRSSRSWARTWLTRPRPEIDQVGSAWLIRFDRIFKGWANRGIPDDEILTKGAACFDGLSAFLRRL